MAKTIMAKFIMAKIIMAKIIMDIIMELVYIQVKLKDLCFKKSAFNI